MPQTEEEHLENQNLDYEDNEKSHPDAEVRIIINQNFFVHSNLKLVFEKISFTDYVLAV